ncbi:MaoC family dehydratase [Paramicrobacterium agarici]|uniref:MaoC dehydratase-like protein n=1 Tax=Paramicrobacterium agarici TaxID=630514 RepID=A0A2A9DRH2_9MICO|nr:MaoC family dehydratase [Microbacterium agarici]PFG29193.1 MaoC dehydratase-like protein [Microbacterium agarici]
MSSATPQVPALSQLAVGDVVAERSVTFTRDSLVRYAGASGDFNPIHYRDDVAASVDLPGVIAHGMLTMGAAVQPVVDWAGDPARITDYQVKFTRPIVVDPQNGADVSIVAKIGALDNDAQTARVDLTVSFDGATVLGKAQVVVELA